MTAVFSKSGNIISVTPKEAVEYLDKLPVGTYVLKLSPDGFYFEIVDSYVIKHKIYGDLTSRADRILNTFMDRPNTTGVLLVGEKGSGKTMLARKVCINAAAAGIPTVIINTAFYGDGFNSFIQSIHQPMVILFDEFEKVYDSHEQEAVLTLLDGVFPTKKLFLITSNDKYKVNDYMRNRPGRIFYLFDFTGIGEAFVREYAIDNLKDEMQQHVDRLVQVSGLFTNFNFDMLKAIVEEMNRYGEKPEDVISLLNTKPEFNYSKTYEIEVYVNGVKIDKDRLNDEEWSGKPLENFALTIHYEKEKTKKGDNRKKDSDSDEEDTNWEIIFLKRDHMVNFNGKAFTFVPQEGVKVILREKEYNKFDWRTSL